MKGSAGISPSADGLAVWAETGVVLADEFRDGNVPAQMEPLNAARRLLPRCRRWWRRIIFAVTRPAMKRGW
jgi:hypothetical protein